MRWRTAGGMVAMMPARKPTMTYAEYFAFEDKATERHEFLDGQVFAMGGGTIEHARLIAGVTITLGNALRDRPCRIFSAELRIRIRATGLTTYPDVSVVCGKAEIDSEDPCAIVNHTLSEQALVEAGAIATERPLRAKRFVLPPTLAYAGRAVLVGATQITPMPRRPRTRQERKQRAPTQYTLPNILRQRRRMRAECRIRPALTSGRTWPLPRNR